jgi:hypothetical protein
MCYIHPPRAATTTRGAQRHSHGRQYQTVALVLYCACLIAAPRAVGTRAFIPGLFLTRLLLLSPWLLAMSNKQEGSIDKVIAAIGSTVALVLALGQLPLDWTLGWQPSITTELKALNDNHAVSALGYDLCIGLCSTLLLFYSGK